ncbi:hypothetical protein ENBRE01_1962 [Enteropsectra breve]|nr:hypothetical protein ENBRE01_1962 [Enteropsectra breve]
MRGANMKSLILIFMGYCTYISAVLVVFLPIIYTIFGLFMSLLLLCSGVVVNSLKFYMQHRLVDETRSHDPFSDSHTSGSSSQRYEMLSLASEDSVSINMPDNSPKSVITNAVKFSSEILKHIANICSIGIFGMIAYNLLFYIDVMSVGKDGITEYAKVVLAVVVSVLSVLLILLNSVHKQVKYVFACVSGLLLSVALVFMLLPTERHELFSYCAHDKNVNVFDVSRFIALPLFLYATSAFDLSTLSLELKNALTASFKTAAMVGGSITAVIIAIVCDFKGNLIRKDMLNLLYFENSKDRSIVDANMSFYEYLDSIIPLAAFSLLAIFSSLSSINSYKQFFMKKIGYFSDLGKMAVMSIVFGIFIGIQSYLQFNYEFYLDMMLTILVISQVYYSYISWMILNYKNIFRGSKSLRNIGYVAIGMFSFVMFLWMLFSTIFFFKGAEVTERAAIESYCRALLFPK